MSSRRTPVPSATHVNGVSAIKVGIVNSSSNKSTSPVNFAPPPVRTNPFSTISADNSGGVCSKTFLVDFIILFKSSSRASFVSSCVNSIESGKPVIKFLPFTTNFSFLDGLYTLAKFIFISSAVFSPISNLYFPRIYFIIS